MVTLLLTEGFSFLISSGLIWGNNQSTAHIIAIPTKNEIAIKNKGVYFKPSGISWTKDMATIMLAAKDREPYKATLLGFLMRPINDPRVCPAKIKDSINKKSFI